MLHRVKANSASQHWRAPELDHRERSPAEDRPDRRPEDRLRTIRKYANRRLYDTADSRYVNLEELAAMVRGGETVRVVDAKSGDDLTRPVLVQVLLEQPGLLDVFPPALLHRVIRTAGQEPLHPLVAQQLAVGFELLETQLVAFEQQFGWSPTPPRPPAPPPREPEEPSPAATAEPPGEDPELSALRERLAALEARLGRGGS